MKNPNDTIGYRTRDLPPCSAVPQSTAPPRAPKISAVTRNFNPLETKVVETVFPGTQTHRQGSDSLLPKRAVCAIHHESNFTVTV